MNSYSSSTGEKLKKTTVAHLVWEAAGAECLRRFLDSYREHDAGAGHELVLLYNGFRSPRQHEDFDYVARETPHIKYVMTRAALDLDAYREVALSRPSSYYLFVNSYARPLVDGWLELLLEHQRRHDVGMVATSGSYESLSSNSPLLARPSRLAQFKRFPNPHLRTGAFTIRSDVIERIDWFRVGRKLDAWKLESGRGGLSAQVMRLGLKLIVAGRDGVGYEWQDWPDSRTFRSGEQENLIIADNRTDDWANAGLEERGRLARLAWGSADR